MKEILINTPLGEMVAVFSTQGLCLLEFVGQKHLAQEWAAVQKARAGHFDHLHTWETLLREELARYFAGDLRDFALPLDPIGTPFQQNVWHILRQIPYGQTWSYAQQAQVLGNARAVRAVAAANGQNKISIIIPCHRVIGSNGQLTGYAGGLARKEALLALEREHVAFELK